MVGVPFTGVSVSESDSEAIVVGVPFTGVSVSDWDSDLVAFSVSEVVGDGGADVDGKTDVLSAALVMDAGVSSAPFPSVYSPVKRFPEPPVSSWKSPTESVQFLSMKIRRIL